MLNSAEKEKVTWFSMWFLGSIASFGAAFFPMFYRLIDSRNKHFQREAQIEKEIGDFMKKRGKHLSQTDVKLREMNAIAWTTSIVFIIPVFLILYSLSKDLIIHEKHEDEFLAAAFPEKMFMPLTIPIKKYVLITIGTLGVGGVYWLYKIINNYNAHFKAQWRIEKEIARMLEEKTVGESM